MNSKIELVCQILRTIYNKRTRVWFLVIIATLLAWNLIHFQINVFLLKTEHWDSLLLCGILYLFCHALLLVWKSKVDRQLLLIFMLHAFAVVAYLAIMPVTNTMLKLSAASLLYWLVGFTIVRSPIYMHSFLNFNFGLVICLILLNTVPIFHWLEIVDLDFHYVERVGGDLHRRDLDPIYFGIFGATENAVNEFYYISTARLQGWSSEPLHWGYFVCLSAGMTLLLMSISKGTGKNLMMGALLLYIIIYSYFLHSSSVNISIIGMLMVLVFYRFFHHRVISDSRKALLLLTLVVIGPGFVIPFILSTIPDIELLFINDDVLGEGSNWGYKIEWLSLDNLYGRFLPQFYENVHASHNAILTYYLNMGYILTLPLLIFFYKLFLITVKADNLYLCTATIVFALTHTLLIDSSLIYPSFVLWFLIIYYVSKKVLDEKNKRFKYDDTIGHSKNNVLKARQVFNESN